MRTSTTLATLPLLLLGCGLLTFEVESSAATSIEGAGVLGELLEALSFSGFSDFNVDVQSAMADQGVAEGDLSEVRVTSFTLTSTPGDMSFIESFAVYISAPGVDEALVASSSTFPTGETVVTLDIATLDLTPYVVSDTSAFRIVADGTAPEDDTEIVADFVISVTATAKGACRQLEDDESE